jgi:hypothetical protein
VFAAGDHAGERTEIVEREARLGDRFGDQRRASQLCAAGAVRSAK